MSIQEILNLSVAERILMVEAIWDSIAKDTAANGVDLDDATKALLDERLQDLNNNPDSGSSWESVKRRLMQ